MGKRVTAFFTALVTAVVNIPIVSASAEINLNTDILPDIKQAPLSDAYMDYLDNPDKYLIKPSVIDMNETADIDINNNLPEKFDLRSEGLVSPVKDQGIYGTCWAHCAASPCASQQWYGPASPPGLPAHHRRQAHRSGPAPLPARKGLPSSRSRPGR